MTVVRVISEPGRFDDTSRGKLAESLTTAVLDVEVGSENPVARRGIMVLFDEQPAERWAVGGRFDDAHVAGGGRLLIMTQAMEGVWTGERRKRLIERYYEALSEALDLGADRSLLGSCWVLFSEIEDGSWGAFGGALTLLDILTPAGFAKEQAADAQELLGRR